MSIKQFFLYNKYSKNKIRKYDRKELLKSLIRFEKLINQFFLKYMMIYKSVVQFINYYTQRKYLILEDLYWVKKNILR